MLAIEEIRKEIRNVFLRLGSDLFLQILKTRIPTNNYLLVLILSNLSWYFILPGWDLL